MQIKFPPLEEWQKPVFEDIKGGLFDYYVVKAKRQVGKSILGIVCLLYFAFRNDGSISACIEPTLKQGRRVFKQLLKALGGEGNSFVKSANAQLLEIEFKNGSQIIFGSAEQEEALRGLTVKGGILVIDEAAFIKDEIYEILYPVVDANAAPVLFISTPLFTSGEFYDKYEEGLVPGGIVKSYDWSKYDTSKYLPVEKLEYYRKRLSPIKFKSEYLGEFITEGSYLFGDLKPVIGALSPKSPVVGGIDWGNGGGGDYTVLTLMDEDAAVTRIYAWNNLAPTAQVEALAGVLNALNLSSVQVEMNSMGAVYKDMLQGKVHTPIVEFNTTNDSKRRIIEKLITAVQTRAITIPDDPELVSQLSHYNVEKTSRGYTYNGESGYHDDYVISLALAYDASAAFVMATLGEIVFI